MTGLVNGLDPRLLAVLDQLEESGCAIDVTSGKRTEKENQALVDKGKAVSDSAHLTGLAADVACQKSWDRWFLVVQAANAGIRRIGIAKTFVHLDVDISKPQSVIWVY